MRTLLFQGEMLGRNRKVARQMRPPRLSTCYAPENAAIGLNFIADSPISTVKLADNREEQRAGRVLSPNREAIAGKGNTSR